MTMKQLCMFTCAMMLSATLFAQETVIEVQGTAEYQREVERYQAEITVSPLIYYSYDQQDKPSLDELTEQFFERMKGIGFDRSRFKPAEKPKYYSSAQEEESIILQFDTSSEAELSKLVNIKRLNGIYVSGGQTYYKPLTNPEKIIAAALKDARENAAAIAKVLGKDVGDVVLVTDQSRLYAGQPDAFYAGEETGKYYLLVKFATK